MDKNKEKNNGTTNGAEEAGNGKKSPVERNEKGQFVNSPGPGRGIRKSSKWMSLEEIEGELQADNEADACLLLEYAMNELGVSNIGAQVGQEIHLNEAELT